MPRLSRAVFAGIPHHITQRRNQREAVFFTEKNRTLYLDWLRDYCEKHGVDILAYCLMTNHTHLIVVPEAAEGLQRVLKPLQVRAETVLKAEEHPWSSVTAHCGPKEVQLLSQSLEKIAGRVLRYRPRRRPKHNKGSH